jgi:hypothetical protein
LLLLTLEDLGAVAGADERAIRGGMAVL